MMYNGAGCNCWVKFVYQMRNTVMSFMSTQVRKEIQVLKDRGSSKDIKELQEKQDSEDLQVIAIMMPLDPKILNVSFSWYSTTCYILNENPMMMNQWLMIKRNQEKSVNYIKTRHHVSYIRSKYDSSVLIIYIMKFCQGQRDWKVFKEVLESEVHLVLQVQMVTKGIMESQATMDMVFRGQQDKK